MNPSKKSASKKDTPKLALDLTFSPKRPQALGEQKKHPVSEMLIKLKSNFLYFWLFFAKRMPSALE
ncbi:hypothetical protein C943_03693 [Mariniradius saccharolyticus AK6]|uniref:Uncharacterized protein n=1 Tax=Mariniradius saccharolyticus AK6 TaxID=1239962 RepID=M7XI22_9BACT|nr:hypothetical protein C943_03693 [Mariniradius saccharolyticus AK6]